MVLKLMVGVKCYYDHFNLLLEEKEM